MTIGAEVLDFWPEPLDLYIPEQSGISFDVHYLYDDDEPVDISGFDARAEIRDLPRTDPSSTVHATFTCTIDDPTTGLVTLELDADAGVDVVERDVWDVILESGDNQITLSAGEVFIKRRVTQ